MKKTIARILRKWADKLTPIEEPITGNSQPYCSELPKIVKSQYKYPVSTTMMNFDLIRHDIAGKMADALLQQGAIHFTVHEGPGLFNTIEGMMLVYPLEEKQS